MPRFWAPGVHGRFVTDHLGCRISGRFRAYVRKLAMVFLTGYLYGILSGSGYIFKYLHKNQRIKHSVLNLIFYDFSLSKFCLYRFPHLVLLRPIVRVSLTLPKCIKSMDTLILETKGHYINMNYYQ